MDILIYGIFCIIGGFILGHAVASMQARKIINELRDKIEGLKKHHKEDHHKDNDFEDCGYHCHYTESYGFVPEAGCPIHD